MTIAVAVIENDDALRGTLAQLIDTCHGLRCAGAYGAGEPALLAFGEGAPDVVVLDLQLPGMSGVEFLGRCKKRFPETRVLTFTQFASDSLVFSAIRAGADGYALKRGGLSVLEEGIRAVHRGDGYFPPSIARKMAQFLRHAPPPPHDGAEFGLTHREVELLDMARQGMDARAMADALGCSYHTVRTHFDHIRQKLEVESRAEAVAKFYRLR